MIGPFFFKEDLGNVVTATKDRYILGPELFWGELEEHENLDEKENLLQQDGAPSHTANITMTWFYEKYQEGLISCKAEVEWTSHSSDLPPSISSNGGS